MTLKKQNLHLCARQDLTHYKAEFMPNCHIPGSEALLKSNNGSVLIKEEI